MAHFYGQLQGSRGEVTRLGSKNSGIETTVASWEGALRVELWHDPEEGTDLFLVRQIQWQNGAGVTETVAKGIVGTPTKGNPEDTKLLQEALQTIVNMQGLGSMQHKMGDLIANTVRKLEERLGLGVSDEP